MTSNFQLEHETLEWFMAKMRAKLLKNAHKVSWEISSEKALFKRLREEADELLIDIEWGNDPDSLVNEAADIANFAMMIADVATKKYGTRDFVNFERSQVQGAKDPK